MFAGSAGLSFAANGPRPNILWLTNEDTGPHLGCYGDRYSTTPNIDRLASRGVIYWNAWSNAPVCAPARTTIISGMYPTSTGSEHMRSLTRLPESMKMFPCYLREAGYYCTNNVKEDYNLEKTGTVWDESSNRAHWRNRKPGQPFFAVFNFTESHESQIRLRPHNAVHDPAKVRLPAYHPDAPEIRQDWAQYYDKITEVDTRVGRVLAELEADGLTGDTIVFQFGDHGSGMPRNKRWPYNSGLRVGMVVSVPEKFRALGGPDYREGGRIQRMVSFVDLAPTVLSLAGIKAPVHMQGQAFLGPHAGPEPSFLHGFRGRMDERYDMVRSVRDRRHVYVRNYMPHRIYGQHLAYMFQTPATQVWKRLYDQGKLKPPQSVFWESKPPEELYDLDADRDEVNNLAGSAAHRSTLERLRKAQREHARRIRDVGFLPEDEIHSRSRGLTPYEMGHDDRRYRLDRVMEAADVASSGQPAMARIDRMLSDADSAVRYWAATGTLIRKSNAVREARPDLIGMLMDSSPSVRVIAAHALAKFGQSEDLEPALEVLIELAAPDRNGIYVSLLALDALDDLDGKAKPLASRIAALARVDPKAPATMRDGAGRIIDKLLADLK